MGHRGLGGALSRNLGTIAIGTAAASLLCEESRLMNSESPSADRIRDIDPPRARESRPAGVGGAGGVGSYESVSASDPPAIR